MIISDGCGVVMSACYPNPPKVEETGPWWTPIPIIIIILFSII